MKPKFNVLKHSIKVVMILSIATTTWLAVASHQALAAGYTVQEINSPGPAMRMSNNSQVTGFYVAKCVTLSSQPKRTICYNAPWLFDGKRVSKLSGSWPSNANAKAVSVNDAGNLVGADLTGAWFYSSGNVAYPDSSVSGTSGTRLFALNNVGEAVGMSYVSSVYQPVMYRYGGIPSPILSPGYSVVDIDDTGMVAGWYKNSANVEQGFVADAGGTITAIPNLDPAINCRPVRISQQSSNGSVWVAGNCAGNRPFRYQLGALNATELSFPGSSNLNVVSINSRGEAAGTAVKPGAYAPDGYTALVWSTDPASPTDLNANQAFAPASAWNTHATDINEAGTVLTGYNDTSGNFYTFLLSLIP